MRKALKTVEIVNFASKVSKSANLSSRDLIESGIAS